MNGLMKTKEAAEYLGFNPVTLYKLAQKGIVPATKVGGNWRFVKEMLDEWVGKRMTRKKRTVLVLDGDGQMQAVLEEALPVQEYRVIVVGTEEQILDEVERRHFDLILLNLASLGNSGADILAGIREMDRQSVVYIFSGHGLSIAEDAMSPGLLRLSGESLNVGEILSVLNVAEG